MGRYSEHEIALLRETKSAGEKGERNRLKIGLYSMESSPERRIRIYGKAREAKKVNYTINGRPGGGQILYSGIQRSMLGKGLELEGGKGL